MRERVARVRESGCVSRSAGCQRLMRGRVARYSGVERRLRVRAARVCVCVCVSVRRSTRSHCSMLCMRVSNSSASVESIQSMLPT
jgi:hypothetical protein